MLLRATLKNGTQLTLSKSGTEGWKAAPSPFVQDDVYAGVVFDANRLTDGFGSPGFGDKAWVAATVTVQPNPAVPLFGRMSAHVFTPTRIVAERKAARLTVPAAGVYVYWFASNEAGWTELHAEGLPTNTSLKVAHSEQLNNGTVREWVVRSQPTPPGRNQHA